MGKVNKDRLPRTHRSINFTEVAGARLFFETDFNKGVLLRTSLKNCFEEH